MIRAFHTSATGMTAQQAVLDNTANNLANLNTTGFKTSEIEFQDMLYIQSVHSHDETGYDLSLCFGTDPVVR